MSDPSGYRRYAVISVDRLLDFEGLKTELDQLWAEAWHEYQDGCKFWEITTADEEARKYVVPSALEERLQMYLESKIRMGSLVDGRVQFRMCEVLASLQMNEGHVASREVAAILRGLGCILKTARVDGHPVKMWQYVVPSN